MGNGIRYILYKDGLSGFYRGFPLLLLRDIPYRIIKLPLYELANDKFIPNDRNAKSYETLLIASSVGMISAALTNPADSIKTLMMSSNNNIRSIFNENGYKILLRGVGYRTIYTGFSNAIFFTYYEYFKNYYNNRKTLV